MLADDKLLIDRMTDLYRKCDKYASPVFSYFLDEREQTVISDELHYSNGYNTVYYGGYENAARCMCGIFPEWEEPDNGMFPIFCIRIRFKFGDKLSHRDYLGAILNLGIERNKIGDIIVLDDGAYVFACNDIADFIVFSLKKIGKRGIVAEKCSDSEIVVPEKEFKTLNCVSASLRLDAVTAAMLNISRNAASKLITDGRVQINHREITDRSKTVSNGDILSVRGFGRFLFDSAGNNTGSGRIHITVKKYI